jgi:hypothetical protein
MHKILLLILCFIFFTPLALAVDDELFIKLNAEAHCSTNKELYSRCFDLKENECIANNIKHLKLCGFDFEKINQSPESQENFNNCVYDQFEKYLLNKGVDLDSPC